MTTNFNEYFSLLNYRYDVAIDINTRGACHLMGFAKKCSKLKLFLQVSTGKYISKPKFVQE